MTEMASGIEVLPYNEVKMADYKPITICTICLSKLAKHISNVTYVCNLNCICKLRYLKKNDNKSQKPSDRSNQEIFLALAHFFTFNQKLYETTQNINSTIV